MGLHVTAFRSFETVARDTEVSPLEPVDHLQPYAFQPFAGMHLEGFSNPRPDDESAGEIVRCDPVFARSVCGVAPAPSYGTYILFREALCRMWLGTTYLEFVTAPDQYRAEPLFDLLYFAYNEGMIGPVSSRRIAEGFAQERRSVIPERWHTLLAEMETVFDFAADGGMVFFH